MKTFWQHPGVPMEVVSRPEPADEEVQIAREAKDLIAGFALMAVVLALTVLVWKFTH